MARGRRPEWAGMVDHLEGSAVAKSRLLAILATAAGQRTQAEACLELGFSERRFHALRGRMLQAALAGLEPRPAGRRPRPSTDDDRVRALETTVRELRLDLQAAQVREEIALVMPRLLQRGRRAKGARRRRAPPNGPRAKRGVSGGSAKSEPAASPADRGAAAPAASVPRGNGNARSVQAPSPSAGGR
jgi:hypothetical protein